jgi:hypothetical protein
LIFLQDYQHRLCEQALTSWSGLSAGFAFGVGAGPVLEFVREEFAVEIGYALREAGLRVGDGLVVDDGTYLLEEEIEQETAGRSPMGSRFSWK